ncbi:MAG: serine/threonine protein kinase [Lentisphaerales bacterium]|nr:MAG: serine/threonine protein kinase [Lentisphaerales bacterium]
MSLAVGTCVGDYEIVARLGDGSTGRTYKAICISSDNPNVARNEIVALKILSLAGNRDEVRAAIETRAAVLSSLSHANIGLCREIFLPSGGLADRLCVVSEFLYGETLADRIAKQSVGIAWEQVKDILNQCIAGFVHAHERGAVHGNIKPSNIFITREGTARLVDFAPLIGTAGSLESGLLNVAGLDYSAPELASDQAGGPDMQADVFSLGVCCYQAIAGHLPFPQLEGDAVAAFRARWLGTEELKPAFRAGAFTIVGSECREFLLLSMRKDRKHRFRTFAEMQEKLSRVIVRHIEGKARYELISYLGHGGFGEVYKARNVETGDVVAIKHMYSGRQPERFVREARLLQKSQHAHIVRFIDFVETEDNEGEPRYFLVMEFLDGMPGWNLRNRVKKAPTGMDTAEVLTLFRHYMDAIQHLHEHGIIHRDIKPANFYAPEGKPDEARLFDMGIAKDVGGTVTTGHIPGTLDYMAPEFVTSKGDRGSERSDIYSAGLALYEALTGTPAFPRLPKKDKEALMEFVARASGATQLAVNYDCPPFTARPELKEVVQKAIARNPRHRYRSAREMKHALERVRGAATATGDPASASREVQPVMQSPGPRKKEPERVEPPAPKPAATPRPPRERRARPADRARAEPAPVRRRNPSPKRIEADVSVDPVGAVAGRYRFLRIMAAMTTLLLVFAGTLWVARELPAYRARERMRQACLRLNVPNAARSYLQDIADQLSIAETWKARDIRHAREWLKREDALLQYAAAVPSAFSSQFKTAIAGKNADAARGIAERWNEAGDMLCVMGQTEEKHAAMLASMIAGIKRLEAVGEILELEDGIPAYLTTENLDQAEDVARKYAELLDSADRQGLGDSGAYLKTVAERLVTAGRDYVARLRDTAKMWYTDGRVENGNAKRDELKKLAENAPLLTSMMRHEYDAAVTAVDAAQAE